MNFGKTFVLTFMPFDKHYIFYTECIYILEQVLSIQPVHVNRYILYCVSIETVFRSEVKEIKGLDKTGVEAAVDFLHASSMCM